MNLGQAVAVCLYEIASRISTQQLRSNGNPTTSGRRRCPSASTRDLELLAGVVEETMLAARYSPPAMRPANRHDLGLLLRRLALTHKDAARILGFFRRILWRLKQNPTGKDRESRNVTRK